MGIGVSILLIAVGAILAFAVDLSVAGLNLYIVGWILIAVGVLGLIMATLIWAPRRRNAVSTEPVDYREVVTREQPTYRRVEERREDPPLS